ncbi:type I polyketide synthase [Candidatus Uabimicrobium amorphum]|uniref:Polyketide synthase n=1 Tax=Uabimicrobium amorphum TaxID=2596890 RepID=A0A5S9ISS6_UABAM|nr:type I polyketide synthase [Candidatus Uabimicrobium amorphum]BBM86752.1 polyketide synthase [Candidatus Uabimicrobium amorphum]
MSNGKDQQLAASKKMLLALKKLKERVKELETEKNEPIAIIGMSCRFPGSNNCGEYWNVLQNGIDAISVVPKERWDIDSYYDPDPDVPGKMYTKYGGFVHNVDSFDAQFFGISPREAVSMDPQHRLFLQVSWEALENARQISPRLRKSRTGVFVGASTNDYSHYFFGGHDSDTIDAYFGTGNSHSAIPGRLSYLLGLQGPSFAVDTACSSSLVALHLACQSLRNKECDLALVGGVNLTLVPFTTINFCKARMMAPDGRCKTFDAAADGYVRGEGCGAIVLKRLSQAQKDRDKILAVIQGSAVNQDGASGGLTAPNGPSQEAVILEALENAGLQPQDIDYVEAHGTGTSLGDPIEIQALANALRNKGGKELIVGSAKTNIGHLEAAAGIAGVIKVVLSLYNERIPQHLHFNNPSPYIPWNDIAIEVAKEGQAWPRGEKPRFAGVSSFAFIGTNAHVVIGEAPQLPKDDNEVDRSFHVLSLSAKKEQNLSVFAEKIHKDLQQTSSSLADYCYTTNTGKGHFSHRLAIAATDKQELVQQLSKFIAKEPMKFSGKVSARDNKVAFLFTGQGSQYPDMGKELYNSCPVFRRYMDKCDAILQEEIGESLLNILYGDDEEKQQLIHHTKYTQPALFCIEYSLAQMWISWGVEPHMVLGHSVGEYTAACVAKIFDLQSGLKLIAKRAQLMNALPQNGGMVSIYATKEQVAELLKPFAVDVAAINGPKSTVVSGEKEQLQNLQQKLDEEKIRYQVLQVSHAFHSRLMDSILDEFSSVANNINYAFPEIAIVSNVTGEIAEAETISNGVYWTKHIREAVNFAKSMETLQEQKCNVLVEVGPTPILLSMGRSCIKAKDLLWLPSLRKNKSDWQQITASIAQMYVQGLEVDWRGFDRDYVRYTTHLPTYPFTQQRYWVQQPTRNIAAQRGTIHPLLQSKFTSPTISNTIFQSQIGTSLWPEVEDHKVYGWKVLPGAAYAEMMCAAQKHIEKPLAIKDLQILEPLILENERSLQMIFSPQSESWEVYSSEDEKQWQLHAVARCAQPKEQQTANLQTIRNDCHIKMPCEELYAFLGKLGFDYGPAFNLLSELSHNGRGEVVARVTVDGSKKFCLNPCALDACFQAFSLALFAEEQSAQNVYIPVAVERYAIFHENISDFWVHIKLRDGAAGETYSGDMQLMTEAGKIVAVVEGFTIKAVSQQMLEKHLNRDVDESLFFIDWQQRDLTTSENDDRPLVVFVQSEEQRQKITEECICVIVSSENKTQDANIFCNPQQDIDWIWEHVPAKAHLMYLWHDNTQALHSNALTLLQLLQSMAQHNNAYKLTLVTQNAQCVIDHDKIDVQASYVWGLGKVISQEYPQLNCQMIDVDNLDIEKICCCSTLWSKEKQIALREECAYVARLTTIDNEKDLVSVPQSEAYRLSIDAKGSIDNLSYQSFNKRTLQEREIEIEVYSTGLNFRDIMNALGLYPGDAGELGGECCGRVVSVGSEVDDLQIGDEVLGIAAGSFANRTYTHRHLVAKKPQDMTYNEAATIPITFLTAYYGLCKLASLKDGQKVLIHSAAGGVGLAAVQIAQHYNAEIFATAGNEEKRSFLKSLGVQHVMDSRSLKFAEEMAGEQIDIVLNALAGEYVEKSMRLLKKDGHFLEIGKTDIWNNEQVSAVSPQLHYFAFDLAEICEKKPQLLQEMLQQIMAMFDKKILCPLPHRIFSREQVISAFRYMAQAKHIGKVVVCEKQKETYISDASYMISGGLGALGLEFAHLLAVSGAKHLVLVSRREDISEVVKQIEKIEQSGAEVTIMRADVADKEMLFAAWEKVAENIPPLRGIIHAAGILDDQLLAQQTSESFARVLRPKVDGAWNLHLLSENMPLDFFVNFSSLASALGSAGQGNYAAANAFLDSLAFLRRQKGLAATVINWGPWAEIGMAADLSKRGQDVWSTMGINTISPQQGRQMYQTINHLTQPQVIAMPIDWTKFAQTFAEEPFFEKIVSVAKTKMSHHEKQESKLLKELEEMPVTQRYDFLRNYVVTKAESILGLSALDTTQPLQEMGLDSLMAIELKNTLEMSVGKTLPATMLFNYPTIELIVSYIANDILDIEFAQEQDDTTPLESQKSDHAEQVEQMSEDEAMELLNQKLSAFNNEDEDDDE